MLSGVLFCRRVLESEVKITEVTWKVLRPVVKLPTPPVALPFCSQTPMHSLHIHKTHAPVSQQGSPSSGKQDPVLGNRAFISDSKRVV